MAASETFIVQSEDPPTTADPTAVPVVTAPRWPQLIPIAQLLAVVLGVLAIIWNQQQTTDNLRTEISSVESGLRAEISELRAEVSENGQRLARIEGFLGIGIPDNPPETGHT